MTNRLQFYIITAFAVILAAMYGLCIQDDTFISFRYAENLVNGNGLVFNPGEYVEGITNPLWTLLFSGLLIFGIDPVIGAYVMGMLSIGLLMWSTLRLSTALKLSWHWVALLVIALDASVLLEAVEGLESVAFAALTTLAVALTFEKLKGQKELWTTGLLCGVALMMRPEGLGVAGLISIGLLLGDGDRRYRLRAVMSVLIPVLTVLLLMTVFRILYYDAILPNTFYAKVGGFQWSRGLTYWVHHALQHPVLWSAIFVGTFLSFKDSRLRLLSVVAVGYTLYVISVGGDFKPTSRFLIPVVPLAAVILAQLCHQKLRHYPILAITVVVVMLFSRWNLYQDSLSWAQTRRMNLLGRKAAGEWFARYTPEDTLMAMHSVGVVPYYAKRPCIDMWGLNDKVIAQTPIKPDPNALIGHQRSNPEYVFSRKPDIYIPEDDWLVLDDLEQPVEDGFPSDFTDNYISVSIPLGASFMNIWVRKEFARDTFRMNLEG